MVRSASAGSPPHPWRALAAVALVVAVTKLWLVWPDEVVAQPNPYDQLRYAEMAEQLIEGHWLGAYGPRTLIREPAYPVWLAAVHFSGLRLRMAAEWLLLAGAGVFSATLLRLGAPLWLAAAALVLLVFHPHGLLVQRELVAEGFYLPVLLLALSGALLAARAGRGVWRAIHALWAGLALGVLWTTRPEKPLLVLLLATAALLAIPAARGRGARPAAALAAAAVVAGVGALAIAAVSSVFAAQNQRHYGVWTTSDLDAPGYLAANRALLAIDHEAPRRFVPVPADVRARAYAASPAFRELRSHLEAERWGHRVSCVMVRVCDDLAGGWFLWTLREAAAEAGHMRTARDGDAYFARIAAELRGACERGEIRCHPVWLAFLHPHPQAWLPYLPESLGDVLGRIASAGSARDRMLVGDDRELSPELRALFDRVANRDPQAAQSGWVAVEGRVSASEDPIVRVDLRVGRKRAPLVVDPEPAAGDASGSVPVAFELAMPSRRRLTDRPVLEVTRTSGRRTAVMVAAALEDPAEHDGLRFDLDARPLRAASTSRAALTWLLWTGHAWGLRGLALLGVGAFAWAAARRRIRLDDPLWTVFALLAVVTAARILLLAMIDASSFAASSSRYVYPASALAALVLLVLGTAVWRAPRRHGDGHGDAAPASTAGARGADVR